MTHSEAVRIAQSGEGSIVSVLLKLSEELKEQKKIAEKRLNDLAELLDKEELDNHNEAIESAFGPHGQG